jgi:CubicO group peptidase (beta-lactamase class C family)
VRHLLTHTSGWFGDFFFDTGAGEDAIARYVEAMADLEQLAPIGGVWSYNNAAFSLAGRVIEVVAGKPYEQVLRQMILDPLGLKMTFFDPGDLITYRFAVGHQKEQVARPWPLPRSAYPAGGVTCTAGDLLTYARFHLGEGLSADGQRLLTKESLAGMQTPQALVWKKEQWGLSWAVDDTYGVRLISHGGGTMGQVSQLILVPEMDFAVAIFTNAEEGGNVTMDVTRRALKDYLGIEISDPEPMQVEEKVLAQYVGTYTNSFSEIHLGVLGGRLICQVIYKMGFPDKDSPPPPSPQPFTVGLCEEDRLIVLDGEEKSSKAEVIRREDGSIGWLRFGRIHRKKV